jgi:hypothetical protein
VSPRQGQPQVEWTPEETARLHQLWNEEGKTSYAIAELLGKTRNAICGKVKREKLKPRPQQRAERVKAATERRPRKRSKLGVFGIVVPATIQPGDMRSLRGAAWAPLPGSRPPISRGPAQGRLQVACWRCANAVLR